MLAAAFHAAHRARHGHADPEGAVEVVNLRVVVERPVVFDGDGAGRGRATSRHGEKAAKGRREIVTREGKRVQAGVWSLGALSPGTTVTGPAILAGSDATALIEPGWRGVAHSSGAVIVERA